MIRTFSMILFLNCVILFLNNGDIFAGISCTGAVSKVFQDTLYYRQMLYNGRIWKSRYGNILDHEFFLTKNWIPGEVTINQKSFSNVMLRYDIFNDELLAMVNQGTFIILSNEKVESFTLKNDLSEYQFKNYSLGNSTGFKGYGHLLYGGETALIVKYNKQIKVLAVENKYDEFYQKQQVYILKDGRFNRLRSRKELFSLLADRRNEIQNYIRENGLSISVSHPETIIPLLRFYDSLTDSR
jgi:hypothetical protein